MTVQPKSREQFIANVLSGLPSGVVKLGILSGTKKAKTEFSTLPDAHYFWVVSIVEGKGSAPFSLLYFRPHRASFGFNLIEMNWSAWPATDEHHLWRALTTKLPFSLMDFLNQRATYRWVPPPPGVVITADNSLKVEVIPHWQIHEGDATDRTDGQHLFCLSCCFQRRH